MTEKEVSSLPGESFSLALSNQLSDLRSLAPQAFEFILYYGNSIPNAALKKLRDFLTEADFVQISPGRRCPPCALEKIKLLRETISDRRQIRIFIASRMLSFQLKRRVNVTVAC